MQIPRHPAPQVLQHHRIIDIETAGPTVNKQFLFYLFTCHLTRPSLSIGIKQVAKEKKANLTRLAASFQDKRGMLVQES